ncbi:MAG TPA: RDD family protein [Gemmatimonadota bacterium]|nr:RDD family protein [Gemmatimonadota bacterium]
MLVDLAAIGIVAGLLRNVGVLLFALLFAWIFYRMAGKRSEDGVTSRFAQLTLRGLAIIALIVAAGQLIGMLGGPGRGDRGAEREAAGLDTAAASTLRHVGLGDVVGALGEVVALRSAGSSPDEARSAARDFADRLVESGVPPEQIREALQDIMRESADSITRVAVVSATMDHVDSLTRDRRASTDTLFAAWSAAVASGDSDAARARREKLTDALVGGTVTRLREENRKLESDLEEARKSPGILRFLQTLAHDLGFGVGWLGLYFTVLPVLWNGRTPGKRLLGICIVRLSGEEIGWWNSFSRFGGYAAGLATGLLGFLQILWDANRQGIQDRIAGTVVVRTRGDGE